MSDVGDLTPKNPALPDRVQVTVAAGDGRRDVTFEHVGGGLFRAAQAGEIEASVRVKAVVTARGAGGQEVGAASEITYEVEWEEPPAARIERVTLPGLLRARPGEKLLVPNRMGQILTAGEGEPPKMRLRTGNLGLATWLVAAVGAGETRLAVWDDPLWDLQVRGDGRSIDVDFAALEPGARVTFESLDAAAGGGDLAALAERYRERCVRLGWVRPWPEKVAERPRRQRLEGAPELRLLCFSRFVPGCWFNDTDQDDLYVDYTFDDVAAIARHWHDKLEIDRAYFMVCGWMRRGYDNQHPDVFPAAEECGGDEALRRASDEVQSLGYLFGLHDNYHDMYADAPSWDPGTLRKNPDGSITLGGKWAGGQAALMCTEAAIPFLERNLPEIRRRYAPDALYIDVIYAAPLLPCRDERHPLSLGEDLKARNRQVAIAKEYAPVFGSEEGQAWGAADADYFEGLLSHYIEKGPAGSFPWFEWVLGDVVHLYPHAWDQATPDRSEYIVRCLSLGRMPVYAVPNGRYFEQPESEWRMSVLHRHYSPRHARLPDLKLPPLDDRTAPFSRADQGWGQDLNRVDRFIKNTFEVLSPVSRALAGERMTAFRRLGPNGLLVETEFGPGNRIVVNEEPEPVRFESAVLPPLGFIARTERFLALHVLEWEGKSYPRPVLFTVTSADGRPLEACAKARIFHGFGEPILSWRGRTWRVERESVVEPPEAKRAV